MAKAFFKGAQGFLELLGLEVREPQHNKGFRLLGIDPCGLGQVDDRSGIGLEPILQYSRCMWLSAYDGSS